MEPILIFYGAWTIEVVGLVLGAGAPAVRLILHSAGASDGIHLNPPIGTLLDADGPEWILKLEVSFDQQPFKGWEPTREFVFDPSRGMTAMVRASHPSPAFHASIALRIVAHDPEMRPHPAHPYDFTIPERVRPPGG